METENKGPSSASSSIMSLGGTVIKQPGNPAPTGVQPGGRISFRLLVIC